MPAIEAGSRAADFSLPALDKEQYSLAGSLKAGPVLVAFFKSSCPVCQFTFPFLERFYRHFRGTGAQIWAVSQDQRDDSRSFASENDLTMPVLLEDVENNYPVSNAYGLTHVPSIFLIGQKGEILHSSVGFVRKDLIQMARKLETLTGKKGFVPFRPDDEVPEWRGG